MADRPSHLRMPATVVILALLAAFWMRSYLYGDKAHFVGSAWGIGITSYVGRIHFNFYPGYPGTEYAGDVLANPGAHHIPGFVVQSWELGESDREYWDTYYYDRMIWPGILFTRARVDIEPEMRFAAGVYHAVVIHYCYPIGVVLAVSAITAFRHSRAKQQASRSLCAKCGYDLRASAERCPECGNPIPKIKNLKP